MKKETVEFSVEAYYTGRYKVETSEGCKVRILATDVRNETFPICALVEVCSGKNSECMVAYRENGHINERQNDKQDLVLVEEVFEEGDVVVQGTAVGIVDRRYNETNYIMKTMLAFPDINGLRYLQTIEPKRLASEEEKLLLYNMLKANGKRYDVERKEVVDLKERPYTYKEMKEAIIKHGGYVVRIKDDEVFLVRRFGDLVVVGDMSLSYREFGDCFNWLDDNTPCFNESE